MRAMDGQKASADNFRNKRRRLNPMDEAMEMSDPCLESSESKGPDLPDLLHWNGVSPEGADLSTRASTETNSNLCLTSVKSIPLCLSPFGEFNPI